ncbi:phage holin [Escherichia coli]
MEKITTGVSYTTSAVGTGYWLLQLLDKVSPSQWVAITDVVKILCHL